MFYEAALGKILLGGLAFGPKASHVYARRPWPLDGDALHHGRG